LVLDGFLPLMLRARYRRIVTFSGRSVVTAMIACTLIGE
jgi:hypothetical protein